MKTHSCANCNRPVHALYKIPKKSSKGYENVCYDCFIERAFHQEHDYKPNFSVYNTPSSINDITFGMEIELEGSNDYNYDQVIKLSKVSLLQIASELDLPPLILKRDGSLQNGVELVTYPMTHDYYKHTYSNFLSKYLQELRSWNFHGKDTCGIHIHLARDKFKDNEHIVKFVYFFSKFADNIYKFSRRTNKDLFNRYSKFKDVTSIKQVLERNYADTYCTTSVGNTEERYSAVNITNEGTVEIRIFQSTLDMHLINAYIEFTLNVWEFTKTMDIDCEFTDFYKFVDTKDTPYLKNDRVFRTFCKPTPIIIEEVKEYVDNDISSLSELETQFYDFEVINLTINDEDIRIPIPNRIREGNITVYNQYVTYFYVILKNFGLVKVMEFYDKVNGSSDDLRFSFITALNGVTTVFDRTRLRNIRYEGYDF